MALNNSKTSTIILILLILIFPNNNYSRESSQVLTTDHFEIKFNSKDGAAAIALASRLESYNEIITAFIEYESDAKITVILSEDNGLKSAARHRDSTLFISKYSDYTDQNKSLYNELFSIYLDLTGSGRGDNSDIGENFTSSIIRYPVLDKNKIEVITKDLVSNSKITPEPGHISKLNRDLQQSIYLAFIDFIINKYSKKVFTRALKDSAYYKNFYNSLSSITGESISEITGKFNIYLQEKGATLREITGNCNPLETDTDYNDISYSISDKGEIAILQQNGSSFKLTIKKGDKTASENLITTENGSKFRDLAYTVNSQIAIAETMQTGSIISIYNTDERTIKRKITLPLYYISEINSMENGEILFSAVCGVKSDIYKLNPDSKKLSLLTDSGSAFYPAYFNKKIYYISKSSQNSINELIPETGEIKKLFPTDQIISGLSVSADGHIIFSLSMNNAENIYSLDLKSLKLNKITENIRLTISPTVINDIIFFITHYKSKFRVFTAQISQNDN